MFLFLSFSHLSPHCRPSSFHLPCVSSLSSTLSLYQGQRSHLTAPVKSITGQTFQAASKAASERGCVFVIDSWLDTGQCMLRASFRILIYTIHSFTQSIRLVIIAVNVFIADTWGLSGLINSSVLMLPWLMLGFTGESDRFKTGWQENDAEQSNWTSLFLEMFRVVQCPEKKMGASFIHVQLSRCQEFCQASHRSVNLVPVKRSVSISLVKHYCLATGGTERERGRDGKREGRIERQRFCCFPSSFNH